jgi:hypothetical protein
MFVTVLAAVGLLRPDWGAIAAALVTPRVPAGGLGWMLGVLGGVGGTVTLLSYGYWIREKQRSGLAGARACRVDLAVAYGLTALFGMAMIVIGSRVGLHQGPLAALDLSEALGSALGPAGKWVFLAGFWAAVFTSLLGVWQSAPYFFADFVRLLGPAPRPAGDLAAGRPYRIYLIAMAAAGIPLLWLSLERAQLLYAVLGAFFMPLLALTLLIMNTRERWVGALRNGWATNVALAGTLALFAWVGVREALEAARRLLG